MTQYSKQLQPTNYKPHINSVKRNTNSNTRSEFENKNYFEEVQNDALSKYAYHQHGYDLNAYTQMVAAGIEKETAVQNIVYFYQNIHRISGAENS